MKQLTPNKHTAINNKHNFNHSSQLPNQHIQTNHQGFMLATPNRIVRFLFYGIQLWYCSLYRGFPQAAVRVHAKAIGLNTPSPGRAGAAFTMLQLTSSFDVTSTRELERMKRVDVVCKLLLDLFENEVLSQGCFSVLDVTELETKYGFDREILLEVLDILCALKIVVMDSVSGFFVWCGRKTMYESMNILELSKLDCDKTDALKYLTLEIIKWIKKMQPKLIDNTCTLCQIANSLSSSEVDVTSHLYKILSCFLAIGILELVEYNGEYVAELENMPPEADKAERILLRCKLPICTENCKRNTSENDGNEALNHFQPTNTQGLKFSEDATCKFSPVAALNNGDTEMLQAKVDGNAKIIKMMGNPYHRSSVSTNNKRKPFSDKNIKTGEMKFNSQALSTHEQFSLAADSKPFSAAVRNLIGLSAVGKNISQADDIKQAKETGGMARDEVRLLNRLCRKNSKADDQTDDGMLSSQDTIRTNEDNENESTSIQNQGSKFSRMNSLVCDFEDGGFFRAETIDSISSLTFVKLNPEMADKEAASLTDISYS